MQTERNAAGAVLVRPVAAALVLLALPGVASAQDADGPQRGIAQPVNFDGMVASQSVVPAGGSATLTLDGSGGCVFFLQCSCDFTTTVTFSSDRPGVIAPPAPVDLFVQENQISCNSSSVPDQFAALSIGADSTAVPVTITGTSDTGTVHSVVITVLPENNTCAGAQVVGEGSFNGDLQLLTSNGTAACGNSSASPDAWYRYTAPDTGTLQASVSGGAMDTVLSVLDGCGGTELACNDDADAGTTDSHVELAVVGGQEYLVRVSHAAGATPGPYTLQLSFDLCDGDDAFGDSDSDGLCDDIDPCFGPDNVDADGDGVCDSLDLCAGFDDLMDADSDGVPDGCDLAPGTRIGSTVDANGVPVNPLTLADPLDTRAIEIIGEDSPRAITTVGFYNTIQAAIDGAIDGDHVVLANGTYTESGINLRGKAITLRSAEPLSAQNVEGTVIDANFTGNVLICNSGETAATSVRGLTITRGQGPFTCRSGGMVIENSAPAVSHCRFVNNGRFATTFCGVDAGLYTAGANGLTVANCTFSDNLFGAYIERAQHQSVAFVNCTFFGSPLRATDFFPDSKRAADRGTPNVAVRNCIFRNSSVSGFGSVSLVIANSIVNQPDPLFVDAAARDLRLQPGSPAIDAGDNSAVPADVTTDLDGFDRFVDIPTVADTGVGTAPIVDMGAFEFQQTCPCDWNADRTLDSNDFFDFLSGFFNDTDADFDGSGSTDSNDFFGFLECFFGPPAGC